MKMEIPKEFARAAKLLTPELRRGALMAPPELMDNAEEIRLRVGQAPTAVVGGRELALIEGYQVSAAEIQLTVEIATRASLHTYADSMRLGFLTAEGGCRLGLCGTAVAENGRISALRRINSVCIRIPREKRGCGDGVLPALMEKGAFVSSIILSPPGGGKTTLLRELVRLLSESGERVSLVDERSEVAGVWEGKPCFDVGPRTDVLTAAPKVQAIGLMLRAMSPQIIAFDEITDPEDIRAAEMASNCGVELLATAHAGCVEDLSARPLYRELLARGVFRRAVTVENKGGIRAYRVEELK